MAETLEEILKNRAPEYIFKLEIKRRYSSGYEVDWYEITDDLVEGGLGKVSRRMDYTPQGYGKFTTATYTFKVNNQTGKYFSQNKPDSIFFGAISRHYTKVKVTAGYYDKDGNEVTAAEFEGLINEKATTTDFQKNIITFNTVAYESLFSEKSVGELSGSSTIKDFIDDLMDDTFLTDYITYDTGEINPSYNAPLDDLSAYSNLKKSDIMNKLCTIGNAMWYVDFVTNKLFVTDRTPNSDTPVELVGGTQQTNAVNLVNITKVDEGMNNLINKVEFDNGTTIVTNQSSSSINRYGEQKLPISDSAITTTSTINALATDILNTFNELKLLVECETQYFSDRLGIKDKCTIDWQQTPANYGNATILLINGGGKWNNEEIYKYFETVLIFTPNSQYFSVGYEHDFNSMKTKHFLAQV